LQHQIPSTLTYILQASVLERVLAPGPVQVPAQVLVVPA